MTPAGEVPAGTLIFLRCGCSGNRGVSPPDGPVLVMIYRPCPIHAPAGDAQLRYLERWELVSPLSRFQDL